MRKRVLITGSNRGIGLEFTRQYLEDGWRVYATCRHPFEAAELQHLEQIYKELSIHRLDITSNEDVTSIRQELDGIPIDILINNAGVYFKGNSSSLDSIHYDVWLRTFEVNTIGTVRITEALKENLDRSKHNRLITVLSNQMGSIGDIQEDTGCCYRSSKAALNAAMREIAAALKPLEIGVLILHPGDVMTRMGPTDGGIPACDSVRGMRHVIDGFSMEHSGDFIRYDGECLSL